MPARASPDHTRRFQPGRRSMPSGSSSTTTSPPPTSQRRWMRRAASGDISGRGRIASQPASVTPASAASTPAIAHDIANTVRALMPIASAASWSNAVARIATPQSLKRKNA